MTSKPERERAVFRRAARALGLTIDRDEQVLSRDPPEPDILFTAPDGERVAYELVELLDSDIARGLASIQRLQPLIKKALVDRCPDGSKESWKRIGVGVKFKEGASAMAKIRSVDEIAEVTIAHGPVATTTMELPQALRNVVQRINLRKLGGPFGPWVNVDTVIAFDPAPTTEFRAKFTTKRYSSSHPIELLAYINVGPSVDSSIWLPDIETLVQGCLSGSPFRRVWVVDVAGDESLLIKALPRLNRQEP